MWKKLISRIDLDEPTQITFQVYPGCTQREGETNKRLVTDKSELLNKLVSSITSTTRESNNYIKHNVISWSEDMQGRAQKCVERFCELANKTTDELHEVSTVCWIDHRFKNEELGTVGELSECGLANHVDMHVSSSIWPTGHFVDRALSGKSCDEMQQGN